jgi:uncharacterized protein YndB with AHSA1/START domain
MTTAVNQESVQTLHIRREMLIAAPVEITWEAVLEELGPGSQLPDGKPFPMKIEPWPGGRWYRDLGETGGYAYGHLWGHVQVIKAPTLLELVGPMPMSYAAINHVQYRLSAEDGGTRLTLVHRAMGLIPPEHLDGMPEGWTHGLGRIREIAESKAKRNGSR